MDILEHGFSISLIDSLYIIGKASFRAHAQNARRAHPLRRLMHFHAPTPYSPTRSHGGHARAHAYDGRITAGDGEDAAQLR
jgi:hypothetical protein